MLLYARCRDVAPKDLPSARFDSGTAKTVHANVTGQWMFQKSSAPNQGQSAALVSWSSAPYPPTRCRWPVPARLANAVMAASRVADVAVRSGAILVLPKGQRPHPRRTYWRSVNLEDAADYSAIGQHVEIVIIPFAGRARGGGTLEDQRRRWTLNHPLHPFSSRQSSLRSMLAPHIPGLSDTISLGCCDIGNSSLSLLRTHSHARSLTAR